MTGSTPSDDHDLPASDDFQTIAVPKPVAAPPVNLPLADDFQTIAVAKPVAAPPAEVAVMGANPDAAVPFVFGRRIAKGGMGAILEGDDRKLGRKIAVKVMLDANASDDQARRFVQEAAVLGRLAHPNIVPIHDLGRDEEGALYYTMKLVKGRTLQHILDELRRQHPEDLQHYTLDRLLTIFCKVCDAMAFSHSQGIIHRDLKPENIMVGEFGEVLVMDWGISKVLGEVETPSLEPRQPPSMSGTSSFTATMDGAVMGTPNYMSPEQALGKINELDERSDIFSLGGILYAILTLRPPVEGKDLSEVLAKVQAANITSPTEFGATIGKGKPRAKGEVLEAKKVTPLPHMPVGKVPPALSAVAMKALTLDKAKRYQNVAAFSVDIEKYQGGFATSAEQAGWFKRTSLAIKRNKAASIGAAMVLLVGSTLGTQAVIEGRRATRALTDLKASAPSLLELAGSKADRQQFTAALRDLDAVIGLDPALAAARWQRVWVLIGMEKWSEAAGALRLARQHDPSSKKLAAILPKLEELAATDEAKRWTPERMTALAAYLQDVGASGAQVALSAKLKLGAEARRQLVQKRVAQWLGDKAKFTCGVTADNWVELNLHGLPVDSLEPLRGLPLDRLDLSDTKVTDLSPLRGMKLSMINLQRTGVTDISPLTGMPLRDFTSSGSVPTHDFSALRGAPLQSFRGFPGDKVGDLSFLAGAPLKIVWASDVQISSLEALRGAPLTSVMAYGNRISDLSPLRNEALTWLNLHGNNISDLRPLRGLPISTLSIAGNPITDFSPLLDLPKLETLHVTGPMEKLAVLRHHPTLKFIHIGAPGPGVLLRPVAEFWAEYDVQFAPVVKLKLAAEARRQLVDERVQQWLGANAKEKTILTEEGLVELNLANQPIDTVEPLRGLPIDRLKLQGTSIADLSPLRGMKLSMINLYQTKVTDISPLAGMPLLDFASPGTGLIHDFTPLRGAPLQYFQNWGAPVGDPSFLAGAPLKVIWIYGAGIDNLRFLRDTPVEVLGAGGNQISDLSPLRGTPITSLSIASNQISDLGPLRGLPIINLVIANNPIKDFSPLLDLPKLEILAVQGPMEKLAVLRQHPTLKSILYGVPGTGTPARPVAEFWAEYDAQQAAKK